jgi:GT2 family glycosyltransferase
VFARRTAFESVGGFDDDYFMYMEDVDLAWRLRQHGWKIVYEPAAVLTHVGGVSTGVMPYRMLRHHHRSAIRYNMRTARGAQRILLPVLIAGLALRLPAAWLHHYLKQRRRTGPQD